MKRNENLNTQKSSKNGTNNDKKREQNAQEFGALSKDVPHRAGVRRSRAGRKEAWRSRGTSKGQPRTSQLSTGTRAGQEAQRAPARPPQDPTRAQHIPAAGTQARILEEAWGWAEGNKPHPTEQGTQSQKTSHSNHAQEESGVNQVLMFKGKKNKNTNLEFCIQRNYPSKVKENKDFLRQTNTEGTQSPADLPCKKC